jgi:hypothetical protein
LTLIVIEGYRAGMQRVHARNPNRERRTALAHLAWPPSFKERMRALEAEANLTLNELVLRGMHIALEDKERLLKGPIPGYDPAPAPVAEDEDKGRAA